MTQMINVLKRLAELDSTNSNVVSEDAVSESVVNSAYKKLMSLISAGKEPYAAFDVVERLLQTSDYAADTESVMQQIKRRYEEENTADPATDADIAVMNQPSIDRANNMTDILQRESSDLKKLAGIKTAVAECGGMPTPGTQASINITASTGDEVSGMIKSLMGLAGVSATSMEPNSSQEEPVEVEIDSSPDMGNMKDLINAIDSAEVEEPEMDEDSMNRPYDNSPDEELGQDGVRQFGDINSGDHRERQKGLPVGNPETMESIVSALFAEYQTFLSESSAQKKRVSEMHVGIPGGNDSNDTAWDVSNIQGDTTYDTINHPKFGKILWTNSGGLHMITTHGNNGSTIIHALGKQADIASKWANLKKKLDKQQSSESLTSEAGRPVKPGQKPYNFDAADLDRLTKIRDLDQLKQAAIELISTESDRPMKPEKVQWFTNAITRAPDGLTIIKMMYDLLLSGDGLGVIGSSKSYRSKFKE